MNDLIDDYLRGAQTARAWATEAGCALRAEAWLPSRIEECVAKNLALALRPVLASPSQRVPAWPQITQLGRHASILRLAAHAVGTDGLSAAEIAPPSPAEVISLNGLLSGLHGEAVW